MQQAERQWRQTNPERQAERQWQNGRQAESRQAPTGGRTAERRYKVNAKSAGTAQQKTQTKIPVQAARNGTQAVAERKQAGRQQAERGVKIWCRPVAGSSSDPAGR